ncbi:unnamed protein product, partial [Medioppia subpectinata]
VGFMSRSMPETFEANRPFTFFLMSKYEAKKNMILFSGTYRCRRLQTTDRIGADDCRPPTGAAMNRDQTTDGWVRVFEVIEPQRHRKGFTVYKVVSRIYHKSAVDGVTEIVAHKRYSEFKRLHKSLAHLHQSLHLKGVFPAFPDAKVFGRFDAAVIETRRQSALELLDFAAKHPTLFTSTVFVKFFENSVTNFTPSVANHDVIDSPIDGDTDGLPQPMTPSLSPSDEWSQRSGDTMSGDDSSFYSTPIHDSADNPVVSQHIVTNAQTVITELADSVTRTSDDNNTPVIESPQEPQSSDDKSKDWFLYAIKSCDSQPSNELPSTPTHPENCDNDMNVNIPEPFAELMPKSDENKTIFEDIPSITVSKQFSISLDLDDTSEADASTNTAVADDDGNQNLNPSQTMSEPPAVVPMIDAVPPTSSVSDTYLLDAAIILRQAQQHEESEEWEPAFESYKCAVGILLQGVVDETDTEKKASIRRKTFQYLTKAEEIYDTYLSQTNSFQPSRRWAPDSPFKSLNASLVQSWFGSSHELSKFKVIGVDSRRVQIVLDTTTNNIFVIKVIYKSSNHIDSRNTAVSSTQTLLSTNTLSLAQSIFPNDIPFMVQIYRIFKTEYALFLLLEYAKGGKLWDRITANNNNTRQSFSPCPDCTFATDDRDYERIADNAYSGRRISRTRSECGSLTDGNGSGAHYSNVFETISEQQVLRKSDSVDSCSPSGSLASIESIDCDVPSKSYLSLCNNYALEQQRYPQNHSLLADCKLGYISDSIDSIDSITEYESKAYAPYELSESKTKSRRGLSGGRPPQRQSSMESLGITGLLAKARGILKNVDQTLNITKYMAKNTNQNSNIVNRAQDLRPSKSEMSLSQFTPRTIEEVFHQMDGTSSPTTSSGNPCCSNRPLVTEWEAKVWLSQIVRCLQNLHKLGAIYCDLKPENILLNEDNNICVSYKCFWNESQLHVMDEWAREHLYVAPELIKSEKVNHLCDWWSFGVIAFELLTARSLVSYYPNGITSHTSLFFPVFISLEAKDLINKLLQPNPNERLGRHGPEEITTHPFFEGINWTNNL